MITSQIKYTNHLINENSPYLLQHAHNPVNWFPWGEEAFVKARSENKLVLVSVGYAACHWCHVMEKESFEDEEVAAIMNQYFVCIKVDREERPDIDQVYMDAVQLLTRHGGWPLNCFALPDGRPVYGGTYFPKKNWIEVLLSLQNIYVNDYEKVQEQANAISAGLSDVSPLISTTAKTDFSDSYLEKYYRILSRSFDRDNGGNKGAPKFPMPVVFEFLLRYHFHTHNEQALADTVLVLDKMASGGIYDQLGGGFARYSTDERWFAPHFEKMLYDNAQLISLYSKAFKLTRNPVYGRIIRESMTFVERELTSPEGAFYSSLDADSEGEEGRFYVWSKEEIEQLLGDKSSLFCRSYNVSRSGNWEHGRNILFLTAFPASNDQELTAELESCRDILFRAREKRVRPLLDTKILCSWNALMLEACIDAYTATGETDFYQKAITCAAYLEEHHISNERVLRVNQNGRQINGFLDDYALTARAFIRLFQVSCNEKWLQLARKIADHAMERFSDHTTGMFFYTSDEDPPLVVRKHELHDNVIPSSNSVMTQVLNSLGRYFDHEPYHDRARKMMQIISEQALQYAWYHAGWARTFCDIIFPSFEVAVSGPGAREKIAELESVYLPHLLICGSVNESYLPLLEQRHKPGETWLYVCENNSCKLPVNKVEAVIESVTE